MKLTKMKKNNWLSPDEIYSEDGKEFFSKRNKSKVKIGPSESMSKSKKIPLTQRR